MFANAAGQIDSAPVANGVLISDGYSAYARYAEHSGIVHAQCWARLPQARPPALELDLRDQELLAVLVDGALDHTHDAAQRVVVAAMGAGKAHVEDGHTLAGTRLDPLGVCFGVGEPLLRAVLARVPFEALIITPTKTQLCAET
jgi:hypothetical protein